MIAKFVRFAVVALVVVLAFLYGAVRDHQGQWPANPIRRFEAEWRTPAERRVEIDNLGRLVVYPGKSDVACPAAGPRTAVILAIGQSNASNEAGERGKSHHGANIVSWFEGKCQIAESPLLGTSGERGESWTTLANKLIEAGAYDKVVIVPLAIGGTKVERWAPGGNLFAMLMQQLDKLTPTFQPTHIVWVQGEDDRSQGTDTAAYRQRFLALVDGLRGKGLRAPIFVTRATFCEPDSPWVRENPVGIALDQMPDPAKGIYAGVDTDRLISAEDRMDGCHFGGRGVATFTDAMRDVIVAWDGANRERKGQ
ncbi:sialate O-acetylesterase [Methylocella sp. CPCC 101449]|uniref:sialate O-acetylesterase n=1 Tax=Methylocella sp. CPCC 101449 TaxID=2987531 RepID=UPI002891DD0C|nr:sialate O-acetylesterase [Methylocella sp. CPCC 101449]MDT2022535.1 sialate O-acetylesterase [Methylocella sp. CPCC 101449]